MKNTHEQAFPDEFSEGISRLEYFAAAALIGMLSGLNRVEPAKATLQETVFDIAEAMCAEAERRKAKQ